MNSDENALVIGIGVGFAVAVILAIATGATPKHARAKVRSELCPAILSHSPTYADSLAVIEAHNGCWTFVHPESP